MSSKSVVLRTRRQRRVSLLAPARVSVLGLFLGFALITPSSLFASGPIREVRFGVLNHDTDGLWSGFKLEHGADLNAEVVFDAPLQLGPVTLHPAAGTTINTGGDTSKLYAYLRWEYTTPSGWFVATGLGGAWHDGWRTAGRPDRKALGSTLLFHIPLEAGYVFAGGHSVSVYFDHMSNARLADENEGMDTLGMRYGCRF